MIHNKIAIGVAFFMFGYTQAQQSARLSQPTSYSMDLAENLFDTQLLHPSKNIYDIQFLYNDNLPTLDREASQFFGNMISVLLQKTNAEKGLEAFVKEHPQSAYFSKANLPLADYYLAKKDFKKAIEVLRKINQSQLSKSDNAAYVLKLGYAKFMQGDVKSAMTALLEAYQNSKNNQRDDIAYMLGHLYYSQGDSNNAFSYFETLRSKETFFNLVQPYYIQMYYNQGDYEKAIEEGKALINANHTQGFVYEAHKIVGESYFKLNNYEAAYPYLKKYLENTENPSDTDLYEMGFVSAQLHNYAEAVSYYNQLINSNSSLAQNAFYQLGNAYLQNNQKAEALVAFRSASQMQYDEQAKKLAAQQYAKLSYEIGNPFDAPAKVLQDYIEEYGKGDDGAEIKKLLVKSYLYSGDYRATLDAIDRLIGTTPEVKKIDQEVSYLLGTVEYNNQNYENAEKYYLRSLKNPLSEDFTHNAIYGLGRTYEALEKYQEALAQYQKLKNISQFEKKNQLSYDMGYAYFKLQKYADARNAFQSYLQNPDTEHKNDAWARIADAYYAENKPNEALNAITNISTQDAYSLYRKALILGDLEKYSEKISTLKTLLSNFPTSEYKDDAEYEIGLSYSAQKDFKNAQNAFTNVIKKSTDKNLVAQAEINIVQNDLQNNASQGEKQLLTLAQKYKNTEHALMLMQTAKVHYTQKGDTAGLQSIADTMGINLAQSEIEEINLSSARNFYAEKKYNQAIPLYEKYLAKNHSSSTITIQYELGDSYYQLKNYTKALLTLQDVAKTSGSYQEEAKTRIAQIYLKQNQNEEAITLLESLKESSHTSIKNFALSELINLYSGEKHHTKAISIANTIAEVNTFTPAVTDLAKAIQARELLRQGKDNAAQTAFSKLEKSVNRAVSAEALYRKAYFQNKGKAFKSSNETIFKLANHYASEEYWGAKSLLLMSRNYLALKDQYQASYTLDQIIQNYQDFPEIIDEAKNIKSTLRK